MSEITPEERAAEWEQKSDDYKSGYVEGLKDAQGVVVSDAAASKTYSARTALIDAARSINATVSTLVLMSLKQPELPLD
jgi:hypothetical protein